MVKKLYKHEFIALLKWILPLNLFCLLAATFLRVAIALNSVIPENMALNVITVLFTLTFVISIAGASVAALAFVIVRFYKHLLSQEGYLTFTIPVTPTTHLVCKLVCGCAVLALTAIGSVLSVGILSIGFEFYDVIEFVKEMFGYYIWDEPEVKGAAILLIVLFVIAVIVGLAQSLLMPFAAMCMGQLSKKNRIARSVVCYIILSMAMSMVTQVVNVITTFFVADIVEDMYDTVSEVGAVLATLNMFNVIMLSATLLSAVFAIAFFLIARHILNNKLNLE